MCCHLQAANRWRWGAVLPSVVRKKKKTMFQGLSSIHSGVLHYTVWGKMYHKYVKSGFIFHIASAQELLESKSWVLTDWILK